MKQASSRSGLINNFPSALMNRIADTFLLLRSVMVQLLAFDPTQRLSAEAALKILHRGSLRPSEGRLQQGASPPRASAAAGNENAEGAGDVGACDGDFWKLESILRVGDLRATQYAFCCMRVAARSIGSP